jgi:hypothetical protein
MSQFRSNFLRERVKHIAPGCITERDGGDWYAVAPDGSRLAEGFRDRDDARRVILWLAGDPMPDEWSILKADDLSCEVDCSQGHPATIWTREAIKCFPRRANALAAVRT